jgi:hypothetical protein
VRHDTEVLQVLQTDRVVESLVEAEVDEKECCICLKTKEIGKFLTLVS